MYSGIYGRKSDVIVVRAIIIARSISLIGINIFWLHQWTIIFRTHILDYKNHGTQAMAYFETAGGDVCS